MATAPSVQGVTATMSHITTPKRRTSKLGVWFTNLGIATKLIIITYVGFLTIFLFVTALMVVSSQSNSIEAKKEQAEKFLSGGLNLLREEMQYMVGSAEYIGLTSDIQTMMENSNRGMRLGEPSSTLAAIARQRLFVSVVVYDRSGHVLDSYAIDGSSGPLDQLPGEGTHPFDLFITGSRPAEWQFIPEGSGFYMMRDFSPKLCLWQRVQSIKTRDVIGAIAVCIDVRKLLNAGPRLGPEYHSIIMLSEKNEMAFNNTGIQLEPDTVAKINAFSSSGDNQVTIGSVTYWAFTTRVANTYLRLLYLMPKDIPWDMSGYAVYTILAVALLLLLLYPLFRYLTKFITKPIKILIASMESFSQGDVTRRVGFRYQDEVGLLGKIFDSMLSENKRLINVNYMLTLKEREAELASLQSQINPHFLYNVVNSIQWLALKNHNTEVADLIYSLGRVFRYSIGTKEKTISIRQEAQMVQDYLKLQKLCYHDRFEYSVSIEDEAYERKIPRLCLQPLVENAIVHGVEHSDRKVSIFARVFLSQGGQSLHMEVYDDGPGIAPDTLALLPDGLQPADPPGLSDRSRDRSRVAMKNISDRLRILYGEGYSFTVTSKPYEQTVVRIVLPLGGVTEAQDGEGTCADA